MFDLDPADLRLANSALGLPPAEPGTRAYSDADAELARMLALGIQGGVPVEAIAEINRVIARGMAQIAAATRMTVIEATLRAGMTEREAALAWAQAARRLGPNMITVLTLAYELHLRKAVRSEYIGAADIVAGRTPGARTVTVAFADLVGFTRLGQAVPPEQLGAVARRLEELTARAIRPPVSLVKTVGDAVMLVSPEAPPMLETVLCLVEEVRAAGPGFPEVRAGIALGAALERAGDWYGDTVNLASRLAGAAPPSGVVATDPVRRAAGEGYRFEDAGRPRLKGIAEPPALFSVSRR
jgi:adenylate cyclase